MDQWIHWMNLLVYHFATLPHTNGFIIFFRAVWLFGMKGDGKNGRVSPYMLVRVLE